MLCFIHSEMLFCKFSTNITYKNKSKRIINNDKRLVCKHIRVLCMTEALRLEGVTSIRRSIVSLLTSDVNSRLGINFYCLRLSCRSYFILLCCLNIQFQTVSYKIKMCTYVRHYLSCTSCVIRFQEQYEIHVYNTAESV